MEWIEDVHFSNIEMMCSMFRFKPTRDPRLEKEKKKYYTFSLSHL
jgi:hypothetical protein